MRCGRKKAVTPVKKNTLDPSFNSKVQFFISNPSSAEVTVEVCVCVCVCVCVYVCVCVCVLCIYYHEECISIHVCVHV